MYECPSCKARLSTEEIKSRQCSRCGATWQGELTRAKAPEATLTPPDLEAQLAAAATLEMSGASGDPATPSNSDSNPATTSGISESNDLPREDLSDEAAVGTVAELAAESSAADTKEEVDALSTLEQNLPDDERPLSGENLQTYWQDLSQSGATPTVTLGAGLLGPKQLARSTDLDVRTPQRSLGQAGSATLPDADYEIIRIAGEGSMGQVFVARQNSIQRLVAVKQLKQDLAEQEKHRTKFLAEAAITGELDHPNIVPVHDLGVSQDGELFYSMKMIQGQDWQESIGQKSRSENLEILLRIADAIAFAHSRHIIHRDLKPENVMLGSFGEVLVTDWGIAVQLDKDHNFGLAGTPAYMAPEMAKGPPRSIGKHSDIYLLGAMLFQVIVGKAPHHLTDDTWAVLRHAAANDIVETDREDELLSIAHKALATRPQDRYPTVESFQTAIRQYQTHAESLAILQRAEADLEAAQVSDSEEGFSKAIFGFQDAIALWSGNHRAYQQLREAKLAYAEHSLKAENFDLGLSLLDANDERDQPLLKKLHAGKKERDQRARRLKLMRLTALALVGVVGVVLAASSAIVIGKNSQLQSTNVELSQTIDQRDDAVTSLNSKNEELEETNSRLTETISARDKAVESLDAANEDLKTTIGERNEALETATRNEVIANEEREKAESRLQRALRGDFISSIGYADSKLDADESSKALRRLRELKTDEQLKAFADWEWDRLYYLCHPDTESSVLGRDWQAFAADANDRVLASTRAASRGTEVQLWNVDGDGVPQPGLKTIVEGLNATCVALSSDGQYLAVGGSAIGGGANDPIGVVLRNTDSALSQEQVITKGTSSASISKVAFHPSSSWLAAVRGATVLNFRRSDSANWVLDEENLLRHRGRINDVAFAPDGSAMAVLNASKKWKEQQGVYIWPLEQGRVAMGEGYKTKAVGEFDTIAFSPRDAASIAIGTSKGIVSLWDWRQAGKPCQVLTLKSGIADLNFSRTGDRLVVSTEQDFQIYEDISDCVSDWRLSEQVPVIQDDRQTLVSSQYIDGSRLVSLTSQGNARQWDFDKYFDEVSFFHDASADSLPCSGSAFGPRGQLFLTAGENGSIRLWQGVGAENPGATRAATGLYVGHPRKRTSGNFQAGLLRLPDTNDVAVATTFCEDPRQTTKVLDGSLSLWEVESGRFLHDTPTLRSDLMVASPDSRFVALRHRNVEDQLTLWRFDSGKNYESKQVAALKDGVAGLAFRPGTSQLFVGRTDGSGRLLSPPYSAMNKKFGNIAGTLDNSAFTAQGKWLVYSGKCNRGHCLWYADPETGEVLGGENIVGFKDTILHLGAAANSPTYCVVVLSGQSRNPNPTTKNRLSVVEFSNGRPMLTAQSAAGAYFNAAISPDGKTVLALKRGDVGIELVQWLPESKRQFTHPLSTLLADTTPEKVVFVDQNRVMTYGIQQRSNRPLAQIWDLRTNEELSRMASGSAVLAVKYLADREEVLAASQSGIVYRWDVKDFRRPAIRKQNLIPGMTFVRRAAISQDAQQVVMVGDNQAAVMETASNSITPVTSGQSKPAAVASSNEGVAIAFADGRIWVRRSTSEEHWIEAESNGSPSCMCMSADSSAIAALVANRLHLWKWENGQWAIDLSTDGQSDTTALAFSLSKNRLVTGNRKGVVDVWHIDRENKVVTPLFDWSAHDLDEVRSLEFSPDGKHLATTSAKGKATIWPTQSE